jgi:hypothetical protein
MGPMTGRAAGYCAGYPAPGFMNPVFGRGLGGRGLGRGRGRRNLYWATGLPGWARAGWTPYAGAPAAVPPYAATAFTSPMPPEAELDALRRQAEYFSSALEEVRKRMGELESASGEKAEAGGT